MRFRDELNDKFWVNGTLRPQVRKSIMNFAKAFADYVDLNERAVVDVLMLGGNAG